MQQEDVMSTETISGRVPKQLRTQIDEIAKAEKRSISNVVEMALESFVRQYSELRPQFKADILAGLQQLDRGDVVPYERG
jgi:predicted transcriptional regulator